MSLDGWLGIKKYCYKWCLMECFNVFFKSLVFLAVLFRVNIHSSMKSGVPYQNFIFWLQDKIFVCDFYAYNFSNCEILKLFILLFTFFPNVITNMIDFREFALLKIKKFLQLVLLEYTKRYLMKIKFCFKMYFCQQ